MGTTACRRSAPCMPHARAVCCVARGLVCCRRPGAQAAAPQPALPAGRRPHGLAHDAARLVRGLLVRCVCPCGHRMHRAASRVHRLPACLPDALLACTPPSAATTPLPAGCATGSTGLSSSRGGARLRRRPRRRQQRRRARRRRQALRRRPDRSCGHAGSLPAELGEGAGCRLPCTLATQQREALVGL